MEPYSHTQKYPTWTYPILVILWIAVVAATVAIVDVLNVPNIVGIPFRVDWLSALFLSVVALGIIIQIISSSLTVIVDERTITWYFRNGRLKQEIPLVDVASAEAIRWYLVRGSGFGYNLLVGASLYSVYGFNFIKITQKDGTKVMLGTNEPQQFLQAINVRIANFPKTS